MKQLNTEMTEQVTYLITVSEYPVLWDDLIERVGRKTVATLLTLDEANKDLEKGVQVYANLDYDALKEGAIHVVKADDGVYDIVVDVPRITVEVAHLCVEALIKETGINYKLTLK